MDGLKIFMDAFHDLDTERPFGLGGVRGIPISAIHQWIRDNNVDDPELKEDIIFHVVNLDKFLIQWMKDNPPKEAPKVGNNRRNKLK